MTTALSPADQPLTIPDPDAIRAAIDATDERARLLRRLLRLSLQLQTPDTPDITHTRQREVAHASR